jgi:eukaryotic-like serine/threonine-protein kinase
MPSLHQRAKDLFLSALARPAAERDAFLADASGSDGPLRKEVESLLAFHEESGGGEGAGLSGPAGEIAGEPFAPGDVFASRYRMITRIGRGGMGDVWRADDLVLETPVALKLIRATGPEARVRILNEVRLARQITHPAVCRVFDVGEASGEIFFSMELVRGEDLASLLKRAGRLPSEKVVDIGRQLALGLAAAHAQGVLHRDLKPANVLIDDNGLVRITDFGIAVTRTESVRHTLIGTPGYMAPEQMVLGAPLTERTDLYALGLVLYELLVGRHPLNRLETEGPPSRPSALVPHVNPQLERVIMHALSPDSQHRPASAAAMASALREIDIGSGTGFAIASAARKERRTRWWLAGAAAAAVVGALAVVAPIFLKQGGRALTGQDTIVLADFANTTGEPVFDGALKVALAVALEQSPFLKVFPDDRVHETLRLMARSPDESVTRSVAREIAQREQLKALLAGSISGLGRNYVIALEAVNAETGDSMAREQVEVTSKEEVLTALGNAASKLREKLGESLASIQKFDVPIARATTTSLDALNAYSLALDQGTVNPRLEALPHLKRAIELDPNFALALALMATVYANNGQTLLAPEYAAKAFALRDRVSERERFFVSFRYYRDGTQDWEGALELTRLWTATYPRESFAFNSLGTALSRFGQYEQSIEPFREAIRLDPRFIAPYPNLVGVLMALNRFDEVKEVLQQAATRQIDSFAVRRLSYLSAFLDGDSAAMARHLNASVGLGETNAAFGWQAHSFAFGGRIAAAHEQFRRGIQMALQGGFKEVAGQLAVEDAEVHALVAQCPATRAEVTEGVALTRDNYTLERGSRALALCGADSESSALSRALAEQFPLATLTTRISLPVTAATLAVHHGESRRAIDTLEPLRIYDHAPKSEFWPAYLRGQAQLQLKNGQEAQREFESILAHRGEAPNSTLYSFAHLGLARAAALSGDVAKARKSYDDFLTLWTDADADLRLLKDVREEYARLQSPS